MIKSQAYKRQGEAVTNFDSCLSEAHAQLARDTLKDPYIFDFLTLDKPFRERELEAGLIQKRMAELFQKNARTINEHIQNIFDEGELTPESVIRKFRITANDRKRYNTL